ncbi:MAG: dipeptidase [Planctomycetota bacterium]
MMGTTLRRAAAAAHVMTMVMAAGLATAQNGDDETTRERALRLMSETPLIDGHNDLPWQLRGRVDGSVTQIDLYEDQTELSGRRPLHTDIPRLREGMVGAQFWSVYVPIRTRGGTPEDVVRTFEQIDIVHRMAEAYPDVFEVALTADDIERIFHEGRIPSLMGLEGGHSIGNSLDILRRTYAAGARYMTLTHSTGTFWADSGTDDAVLDGLSAFGEEVVREMNRLGMLVDLSHVSPATMHDALDIVEAPVIFSHSSAKGVTNHPRNVPDDVLGRLADNGGVVQVTFVPSFVSSAIAAHGERRQAAQRRLESRFPGDADAVRSGMQEWRQNNPAPSATLGDVADHIDHVKTVAGINHVGIGSDFDGIGSVPVGLEDVSTFPDLIVELLDRGWTDTEIRKLLGENMLRAMRETEAIARRLQRTTTPSEKTFEELDGEAPGTTTGRRGTR